ncbi:MAG: chromosome segregation protein SMC [Clostridiales bacterium]|nr:chromosome segregation protein SMC [Clostridiales bacterium]
MYFKRIEMHGFKSFAEPVVIDFHPGVTCIVGPNGSGKSNISDAIRWVLGEQSPKMLRGGKMEEVIFNGTASRKSRGMAEVTLVIDNSTGILPIDYNEVAITRRMYRSGESEYLINNNQCRLRDIRELIMDTGIGVDGYSIIGQGKIQNIVEGKPDERREIFEESAGVVLYKTRKHEAERKLANAQINLDRVNDIIGEIEGRIDGLKEDSEKAQEALEIRAIKRELDINITLRNIDKFTDQEESGADDVKQLIDSLHKLEVDRNTLDLEINKARDRNENLQSLGNEAREKLLKLVNQINEIKNKSQLDDEKLASLDRDIDRLTGEIDELSEKLDKEISVSDEQETKRQALEKELDASSDRLADAIDAYNGFMSVSLKEQSRLDGYKDRIMELSKKSSGLRSEAASVESMKDTLKRRKEQILHDANDLKDNSQAINKEILVTKEAKEKNDLKGREVMERVDIFVKDINKTNDDIKAMNLKIEDLKINHSRVSARKKALEEMESSYEGYNNSVRFIMKGDNHGLRGTVAELINVPRGYEVALETALGQGLQNIVCERDADAKRAIQRLKENSAGRLTFLPMESIKGTRAHLDRAITQANGFEGLACDIATFDKEYTTVFDYLLGRVVIVRDLDTAVRLSKNVAQAVRFVTLEGEVINANGAITGGRFKNKTSNILSRKNEIISLDSEMRRLLKDQEHYSQVREKDEEKLGNLRASLKALEDELNALKLKDVDLQSRIRSLEETLKNAREANEKRDKELQNIDDEFNNTEKLIAEASEKAQACDDEIKELEAKSEEVMKILEENTDKVADSNEAITNARVNKTELENKLEALENLMSITQDNIDELTEQIDDKMDKRDRIEEKREHLMFGSDDSEETYKALNTQREDLEEYIAQVDTERNEVLGSISEMNKQFNEITDAYNSYASQKQQQEIRLAKNEAQLESAKQKLLEDFEISYAQALEYRKDDFVYTTAVKQSREIKNRLEELGNINVGAIEEYKQVSERYGFLLDQRKDITDAMDELNSIIEDMDKIIKNRFKTNFNLVVKNFEKIFKDLFGGGTAELTLDNENDPLESGIEINAQPPGKKLQNINLLSGGEKSMTAIALMFAVLKTKPTPFCILDEVEAALDDANIDRFASYLKNFKDIQFTVVTHQKATMEHADVLYGVTMPEQGISKVLSLRLGSDFEL